MIGAGTTARAAACRASWRFWRSLASACSATALTSGLGSLRSESESARNQLAVAAIHFNRKEYEEALDAYERAFSDKLTTTDRADIYRKMGEAYFRLGNYDEARTTLDTMATLPAGKVRAAVERIALEQQAEGEVNRIRSHIELSPNSSCSAM